MFKELQFTPRNTKTRLIKIILLGAFLLSFNFILSACSKSSNTSSTKTQDDDIFLGSKDAKYTLIEYASLTCVHCASFQTNILPAIKEKYIDTGILRIVYRDMPTPPAQFSYAASMISRCVAKKSGFDGFHAIIDILFRTQERWIYDQAPPAELRKIASQAGLKGKEFDNCLNDTELKKQLDKRVQYGEDEYGITGTPFLFLGKTSLKLTTLALLEEDLRKNIPDLDKLLAEVGFIQNDKNANNGNNDGKKQDSKTP